ncbi:MAG: 1-(5-phosphoribosyl)-5-[(5-phosphoribosylamino)methylideneamino]imidazole-4-carboxamide isomerase [Pantoea sp. Brub]|nr:1-(5-phosphoribosyl)-5-[(5-phosphoribosylamino)methylideneamino]imidazole-4-carboxamide isomerase [Pantoea sp. Brub]
MIIPAIDLIDGKVVRLYQGNYNQQFNYSKNPLKYLQYYVKQGANIIHLIDLTGAKNPDNRQIVFIEKLLNNINIDIQIGGGIRHSKDIKTLLSIGVNRVVIGSMAVQQIEQVREWFIQFGSDSIILAIDLFIDEFNSQKVAIHGWQKQTDLNLDNIIKNFKSVGLKHVLCTDISRDGTLKGPNVDLYKMLTKKYPNISFQSSGGVRSLQDIKLLSKSGVHGVIIGRALLENKFTLSEAIQCWQKE